MYSVCGDTLDKNLEIPCSNPHTLHTGTSSKLPTIALLFFQWFLTQSQRQTQVYSNRSSGRFCFCLDCLRFFCFCLREKTCPYTKSIYRFEISRRRAFLLLTISYLVKAASCTPEGAGVHNIPSHELLAAASVVPSGVELMLQH
jgi:hypothetical protein